MQVGTSLLYGSCVCHKGYAVSAEMVSPFRSWLRLCRQKLLCSPPHPPPDSICSRLCNPPTSHRLSEKSSFSFLENWEVFSTHSLTPLSGLTFPFSVFCFWLIPSYRMRSVSGLGSGQVSKFPFSFFLFCFLMTLIHPGILEGATVALPMFFLFFVLSFCFFFFSAHLKFEGLYRCLLLSKAILSGPLQGTPSCCPWSSLRASERSCHFVKTAEKFKAGVMVVLIPTTWQQRTADVLRSPLTDAEKEPTKALAVVRSSRSVVGSGTKGQAALGDPQGGDTHLCLPFWEEQTNTSTLGLTSFAGQVRTFNPLSKPARGGRGCLHYRWGNGMGEAKEGTWY